MDSDVEETDDHVLYGTPLDPIEEDDIPRKKPFSLEEQVVLDKQGRRRFHGAFTGGFSAGFFNSVGSLEGWTPSTFKSSRSERSGKQSRKPEDYMDEEDMEEFGIAPKVIRATSDFREQQSNKRRRNVPKDGPIPGEPVLHSFLQPVRDTVGVRLLKKMGWKPGQGVGPRLTRMEKKKSAKEHERLKKKVYGCSLPEEFQSSSAPLCASESSEEDEKENVEEEILYAPDDIQPFKCIPKDDYFGIGYSGLDRRPILFADKLGPQKKSFLNMTENKKKISISGQAFGVGAFEEEDEDVYSTEDMSHYDFSLEEVNVQKKEPKKGSRWDCPNRSDGGNYAGEPLEGFVLAQKKPAIKFFPPPKLPSNFQPVHQVRQSRFEPVEDEPVKGDGRKKGLGRHDLTSADREVILSGTRRKTDSTDAISLVVGTKVKVEPGVNEGPSEDNQSSSAENSSSRPAVEAMHNKEKSQFRPFALDPDKQRRYEQYLGLLKFNQKDRLAGLQPLSMTEWERDREKMEFEQASRLYQPLSGAMSDRFVSATHPDVGDDGSPSTIKFAKEEESERKTAAKMKMFGRLTRDRIPWTPCSLLYKRFNIPDPGVSSEPEVKKRAPKFSVFDFMASQAHNSLSSVANEPPSEAKKNVEKNDDKDTTSDPLNIVVAQNITSIPLPQEDVSQTENEDKFPDPPNKIDLFKAIFLSSSESESEDDTTPAKTVEENAVIGHAEPGTSGVSEKNTGVPIVPPASESNVQRNTSPPRGVFANLDLDAINPRLKSQEDKESEKNLLTSEMHPAPNVVDVDFESGAYGPKLPTEVKLGVQSAKSCIIPKLDERKVSDSSSSSEVEWVEKSPRKHKKNKHNRSQRKKSKKHKSKHKHKRK